MIINMNGIDCEIQKIKSYYEKYPYLYGVQVCDGSYYEVLTFEEGLALIKQSVQEGYEEFGTYYFESFFEAGGHIVCDYDEF